MPRRGVDSGFSGPLSTIAMVGIALGVVVMVMAVSILRGFQQDITEKVVGFGSHITVTAYDAVNTYTETPVSIDSNLVLRIKKVSGVRHVQTFATKGGMVKTDEQIYGIMMRGLSDDYDTAFYHACLIDGHLFATPNEVLISSTIASKLKLKVGDKMRTYFWQGGTAGSNAVVDGTYRSRAFTVSGIYNTDLTEMDELYVVGSLSTVQRLNGWDSMQVGGYELLANDYRHLETIAAEVSTQLPIDLRLTTITQAHPALFSWLDLLNTNITLILAIMCLVSAVAIVSALLIMIFEKSATIGLLKALGATNISVRHIFLLKATRLMLLGIAIGDAVALLLSLAQRHWQLVRLDPESYSMSHVPVLIDPWVYIAVSLGTLAVCLLALLLPTASISRISPANTMRVEK
ncbi:MAG: ABC transporter permease [Bacteroidales bacterium]|nr:ABC transporter permease [Bacteroidales bacterium]